MFLKYCLDQSWTALIFHYMQTGQIGRKYTTYRRNAWRNVTTFGCCWYLIRTAMFASAKLPGMHADSMHGSADARPQRSRSWLGQTQSTVAPPPIGTRLPVTPQSCPWGHSLATPLTYSPVSSHNGLATGLKIWIVQDLSALIDRSLLSPVACIAATHVHVRISPCIQCAIVTWPSRRWPRETISICRQSGGGSLTWGSLTPRGQPWTTAAKSRLQRWRRYDMSWRHLPLIRLTFWQKSPSF